MQPSSKSPHRLIVEGPDDKYSVIQLLKRHGFDWEDSSRDRPFVDAAGGITELLSTLATALKIYPRLGIVADADDVPTHRWTQIRQRAASEGVDLPAAPNAEGTVVAGGNPSWRFGVWLMPDNRDSGELEDFLARLVPPGDPCWSHAGEATAKALSLGAKLKEPDHKKGWLHSWLAWQENPGQPFGTALNSHVLGDNSPEALRFVAWFKRLFVNPG